MLTFNNTTRLVYVEAVGFVKYTWTLFDPHLFTAMLGIAPHRASVGVIEANDT